MVVPSSPPQHRACDVVIRQARTIEDFGAIVELQRVVWAAGSAIVPVSQLIAAAHAGGTVLLARDGDRVDGDGRPVGFCYGFVGLDELAAGEQAARRAVTDEHRSWGEPILWSHMLAVLADYRGRGLGRRLKLAQAEVARRRGLNRVLWTFDPLEAANAHLNLRRLGAVAARYSVDRYGPMDDVLNARLETDRLIADWWVGGEPDPHRAHRSPAGWSPGREMLLNPDPPRGPVSPVPPAKPPAVHIAVPAADWRTDPGTARAWRLSVREAFLAATGAGYVAVDIGFHGGLAYYRLERT